MKLRQCGMKDIKREKEQRGEREKLCVAVETRHVNTHEEVSGVLQLYTTHHATSLSKGTWGSNLKRCVRELKVVLSLAETSHTIQMPSFWGVKSS
jgi:hypothetical protein